MNNISKAIVFILAIIGGVGIIVAIATPRMNDSSSNIDFTPSNRITSIEKESFMRSCTGEGADAAYCRCTLDYLVENNTAEEIRAMDRAVTADYMPPEMWEAVNACLHLVDLNEL